MKNPRLRMKTRSAPPATPGMLNGRKTRRNAWSRLAPRLCAARTKAGSMPCMTLASVSTMNGNSTYVIPMTTPAWL